jgi:hypothetical protein
MPRTSTATTSSGFVLLPIGIALTTISHAVDGWAHGLLLGAGVALLLLAAVLLGAGVGTARGRGQGWLPSRDGDGR